MPVITDSKELKKRLKECAKHPFIAIDTEFIRERNYYSKLCLVQIATSPENYFAIDPLAKGIDLQPLFDLLQNPKVVKVFHSCKQDVEIFYQMNDGQIPTPLFDSQVAASVLGYGDTVSYANLVKKICGADVDKSSRFTDWSQRPLSEKQINYALSDVTYLCDIYHELQGKLEELNREHWLNEEMELLADPAQYYTDPETCWLRIKTRGGKQPFLRAVKALAKWREEKAMEKDVPRQHVLRDEALLEIAAADPKSLKDLTEMRRLKKYNVSGKFGQIMLDLLAEARESDEKLTKPKRKELPRGVGPLMDLLKVLLKAQCDEYHVTQKMVAKVEDLELLATSSLEELKAENHPLSHGWRYDIFGKYAFELKAGKLMLSASKNKVKLIEAK